MVDLDEMRKEASIQHQYCNFDTAKMLRDAADELALARAVVEAAGEFENHRLFPKRDDPDFGKADGSVWLGLNKMRDALAAYRAKVGGSK